MRWLAKEKGQTFIEYAAVITCVIVALLAMQYYIQRAVQGRLRSAADQIGNQYAPARVTGEMTTTINREILTTVTTDVPVVIQGVEGKARLTVESILEDETKRKGDETLASFN